MNDEFLYRLRKQPPADFAVRLKAKLDRRRPLEAPRKRGVSFFAVMALLLGGSAFAWVSPAIRTTVIGFFAQLRAEETPPAPSKKPMTAATVMKPPEAPQPAKPASWMWGSESHGTAAAVAAPTPIAKRGQLFVVISWPTVAWPEAMGDALNRGGSGPSFPAVRVEKTGDADAFFFLCDGAGVRYPDAALVFRRMEADDRVVCETNRVGPLVELKVGYEALVLVRDPARAPLAFTRRDLYLALAQVVPDPTEPQQLITNPYDTWRQVNPDLPDEKIEVVGPGTGAVYESFLQLILEAGCQSFPEIQKLRSTDLARYISVCRTPRADGVYLRSNFSDSSIARRLANRPSVGIVGYHLLQQSGEKLAVSTLEGVTATYETIAAGTYSASRPLYLYGKKSHFNLAPDLTRFIRLYATEAVIGPDGYLANRGFMPLSDNERAKSRKDAAALNSFPTTLTGR